MNATIYFILFFIKMGNRKLLSITVIILIFYKWNLNHINWWYKVKLLPIRRLIWNKILLLTNVLVQLLPSFSLDRHFWTILHQCNYFLSMTLYLIKTNYIDTSWEVDDMCDFANIPIRFLFHNIFFYLENCFVNFIIQIERIVMSFFCFVIHMIF